MQMVLNIVKYLNLCLLHQLILTDGEANEKTDADEEVTQKKGRFTVRPLTADELDNYSIYDIVLPLPGYDVVYPEHIKEYYKEAIEEHGLTLEMPQKKVK